MNWERGVGFLNLKEEAEFNLVTIRAYQKALLSAVKNGETTVNLLEDKENEEEGGEDLTD